MKHTRRLILVLAATVITAWMGWSAAVVFAAAGDSAKTAAPQGKAQMADTAHTKPAAAKMNNAGKQDSTKKMTAPAKAVSDTATPAKVKPGTAPKAKAETKEPGAQKAAPKKNPELKAKTETKEPTAQKVAPKKETEPEAEPVDPKAPYKSVKIAPGEKPRISMETSMGKIVLELWPDVAPKHVQSFIYLVNKGFYDSLTFHRIVPGFVIQGGDPLGNGTGGPGYSIPAEFSNKPHEDGVLSMARGSDPNSAGSQFFICLGRLKSLDNKYTVFGKVIEGLDIVHKIEKVPTQGERPITPVYMTKVEVIKSK